MINPGGFRLVVRRGPQPNQVYELNKIGRDITNEITVNDPEVSRHHCRLTRGQGGYTLEDLGSTNGTFINGRRLTGAQPLAPGDLIGLGETVTLAYEPNVGGPQPAVAAAPSPYGAAPDPGLYTGGTSPSPAVGASPRADYYEQPQQPPPAYYAAQQPPYYPGPTGATPAYGYTEQPGARGNRGCGLMIGCGVFIILALVVLVVGIIVVDSPLDDIPFVADAADAVPLPGSSVANAESFLKALGSCDAEKAKKYVCSEVENLLDISATSETTSAACPIKIESVSCQKKGNDVTCDYTVITEGFEGTAATQREFTEIYNIRNARICGVVSYTLSSQ
jgi:hypothetical protein